MNRNRVLFTIFLLSALFRFSACAAPAVTARAPRVVKGEIHVCVNGVDDPLCRVPTELGRE